MQLQIYTLHEDSGGDGQSPQAIREGIEIEAFFLGPVWLLWHGLWLPAVWNGTGLAVWFYGRQWFDVSDVLVWTVLVALQFIIACCANDLRRSALQTDGYRETGVVTAPDVDAALIKFGQNKADQSRAKTGHGVMLDDPQGPADTLQSGPGKMWARRTQTRWQGGLRPTTSPFEPK